MLGVMSSALVIGMTSRAIAQDTAASQETVPAPSEAALSNPDAPALPDIASTEAAIAAEAAAETGAAPAPAPPQSPAQQATQALQQITGQSAQTAAPAGDERPVVPLATNQDSPEAQAAAEQAAQQDALPLSRVRIRTEGFDLSPARIHDVYPGDDPGGLSMEDQTALQEEIRQEAFDAATTGLFPLQPDHIRALLRQYDATERAAQSPPYDLPKPEVVVQTVSMDPGVAPPVIKTAVGHVTTVNILDMTGAPWPVQDITWAGDFEIVEPEEGGHIIRITPMGKFTYGNMAVRLLTLKTPITFSLRVERDSVHYRVDARIPELGPFANAQLMEGTTQLAAGNSTLSTVLDGVPPSGALRLAVSGVDGRTTAYKVGATTYVRTPLTLLSPGWQSSVSSADGMNVYALEDTPVLLLSDQGNFLRAKLSEQKDLFDDQ